MQIVDGVPQAHISLFVAEGPISSLALESYSILNYAYSRSGLLKGIVEQQALQAQCVLI